MQAILALDDEVYIGGHFNTLPEAKLNRVALASFDPANGTPTTWNPGANVPFGVWALALRPCPSAATSPASVDWPAAATLGSCSKGRRRRGPAMRT